MPQNVRFSCDGELFTMDTIHAYPERYNELIINRSGLPHDLSPDQLEELWICEKHRGNMGKNWRPRRTCQYPLHNGRKKQLNTRNAVHLDMSREIYTIFAELVRTGFCK